MDPTCWNTVGQRSVVAQRNTQHDSGCLSFYALTGGWVARKQFCPHIAAAREIDRMILPRPQTVSTKEVVDTEFSG